MRIAICDDNKNDIEHLRKSIVSHSDTHEIIPFFSAKPFLERFYHGEDFDLLFLDVQMPDSDGWAIAKELMMAKHNFFIAMVTVHGEYIYDCFDRVNWFAEKPVAEERVWKILRSAEESLYPKSFEFVHKGIPIALAIPKITCLEVQKNSLFINTLDTFYETRMSLKKAKEMLDDCPDFVQTHSSFIVNLRYYLRMQKNSILLNNHKEVALSRTFKASFMKALARYIQNT